MAGADVGRLAAEFTNFIGRDREIRAVKGLLSTARLVTLTGVGGIGKTRLAIRVAGQLRRVFADGVWQVDVAGLRDPSVLEYAVLEAWGIGGAGDVDPGRLLADYVSDLELLLLLDKQVAELIAEWLSNKQIATRLVISQRTAESHVENILRKLGFTSRARIATWLTHHDRP